MIQVALKRQQAAEDAIAMGIRAVATGDNIPNLPQVSQSLPYSGKGGHFFFFIQTLKSTICVDLHKAFETKNQNNCFYINIYSESTPISTLNVIFFY